MAGIGIGALGASDGLVGFAVAVGIEPVDVHDDVLDAAHYCDCDSDFDFEFGAGPEIAPGIALDVGEIAAVAAEWEVAVGHDFH